MKKIISLILISMLVIYSQTGCKKKKEPAMVDMDTIKTDGSHDDKYIFQKEIEKEERRENRYKKNRFE